MTRLDHPHCVQLFDFGRRPSGHRFLVMPLIEGMPLNAWLRATPSVEQRLQVTFQLVGALATAHAAGIVHRDLKPSNVMIAHTADGPHAYVVDFGIARLSGAPELDITETGEVFGTPGYMSPEQLRGARGAGPRADLYALGVLMFEMFEGRPPFVADNALGLAMQHLTGVPPAMVLPDVPKSVSTTVAQLLRKAPR